MSEMWPQLRPLCRRLALLGWAASAVGMAAGLAVAVGTGTRISPVMGIIQQVALVSTAVSVASFVPAAVLQPWSRPGMPAAGHRAGGIGIGQPGAVEQHEPGDEFPATVHSFLLGSLALLAGAVAFAGAGLVLGPSAQSLAFCQVFLLGATASGFTFMLFSKVASRRGRN